MPINRSASDQATSSKMATILNIFLVILVLLLAYQNYQLKRSSGLKKPKILKIGEQVPKIELVDMYGNINKIDFSDSSHGKSALSLLYIFSINCNACNDNLMNWFKIDSTARAKQINSFYIALDGNNDLIYFHDSNNFRAKIYKPINDNFENDYKIKGIPITLVIDSNRKVRFSHLGKLSSSKMMQILQILASI